MRRIDHFSSALPRVDHIAFVTSDVDLVKRVLDDARVFYKEDIPAETGIHQIFLFDPDGNVIEISNCSPEIGQTRCILTDDEHNQIKAIESSDNVSDLVLDGNSSHVNNLSVLGRSLLEEPYEDEDDWGYDKEYQDDDECSGETKKNTPRGSVTDLLNLSLNAAEWNGR